MEPTWRVVEIDENGNRAIAESLCVYDANLLMELINGDGGHAAIELEDWNESEVDHSDCLAASAADS